MTTWASECAGVRHDVTSNQSRSKSQVNSSLCGNAATRTTTKNYKTNTHFECTAIDIFKQKYDAAFVHAKYLADNNDDTAATTTTTLSYHHFDILNDGQPNQKRATTYHNKSRRRGGSDNDHR